MLLLTPPGRTRWALRRYSEDFPDRLIADVPPWVWRQALRERNTRSQNFECIVPPGAAHRQGITGTTVLPAHFPLEVSVFVPVRVTDGACRTGFSDRRVTRSRSGR